MAQESLEIRVGADLSSAEQEFKNLQKNIAKAMEGGEKSFQDFVKTFQRGSTQLNSALGGVKKPAADASNALGNLSRIAQDAPFGLIGITNNINPMLESFQRLQKETGSTSAALKSMIGGLVGPAGLGLAVGTISSLLLVFGDKLFSSSTKVTEAQKRVDEYNNTVKEAISSVAQEATKVEILIAQLQKENLSRAEKISIVKELQSIAPGYFATLNAEKATVQEIIGVYNNYATSLRNAAKGKVLEKQLEDIINKRLELEKVLNPAQFVFDEKGNKIRNFIYEDAEALELKKQRQREYNTLLENEKRLAKDIALIKPVEIKQTALKVDKPVKIKKEIEKLLELPKPTIEGEAYTLPQWWDREIAAVNKMASLNPIRVNVASDFKFDPAMIEKFVQLTNLAHSLKDAFEGVFTSILSGANVFDTLANTVTNAIKKIIAQLAALAVVSAIFSLTGLGGALGLGKGFGNIFKKLFGGFKLFAEGGVVFGPTAAMIGEGVGTSKSNPEIVAPLDKLKSMIGGMQTQPAYLPKHRISGDELILWYETARRSQGRRF